MNIIIWVNFIITIIITFLLLNKIFLYRFKFEWQKTFWAQYKTGIELW